MVSSISTNQLEYSSACEQRTSSSVVEDMDAFFIGLRISVGEHNGTVRYIGNVDGYSGVWLGVDWDSPERGKHNGIVGEKTYFIAKHAKSASFVRPNKVNTGVSVDRALAEKYGREGNEEEEAIRTAKLQSVSKSINAPFLELVGFDKVLELQSDFQRLTVVNLRRLQVNDSGDLNKLAQLCPSIRELDLSYNLFSSWISIFKICENMEHLRRLHVSGNVLTIPSQIPSGVLSQVTSIHCDGMNLSWHNILFISTAWPNVEELHAPFNNIYHLESDLNMLEKFPKLRDLYLQNNPFSSWKEINKLGQLKNLEKLLLTECAIQYIEFPDDKNGKTNLFKNLKYLSLTQNLIDNWKSIQELDKLQSLVNLKINANPIDTLDSSIKTCFQLIVARIGNLENLNGTQLLPEEKRGAEYEYMNKYASEWIEAQINATKMKEFSENHPRYIHLVKKYGSPECAQQTKFTTLKSHLIELELIFDERRTLKKVPPSMSVEKLMTLVQRIFRLETKPRLTYNSVNETVRNERQFENIMKELNFYSLQDGDQIYVMID